MGAQIWRVSLLIAWLLLFPTFVSADEVVKEIEINEVKQNFQFKIQSDFNGFDVDLILPNGKKIKHDSFDENHYMYFSFSNERVWGVRDVRPGTYTFVISSSAEEKEYEVKTKEAVERPTFTWVSPNEDVAVSQEDEVVIQWDYTGNFGRDEVEFFIRPEAGWQRISVGDVGVESGEYTFNMPSTLPSGTYPLKAYVKNEMVKNQDVDPGVSIEYDNPSYNPGTFELLQTYVENGGLYATFRLPNDHDWESVESLVQGVTNDEIFQSSSHIEDLQVVREEENAIVYEWLVVQIEKDGTYNGKLVLKEGDQHLSFNEDIPAFEIHNRSFTKDQIEWSIQEERTGESQVSVSVTFDDPVTLSVKDKNKLLFERDVEGKTKIDIPLEEGVRVISLHIEDAYSNTKTFSKRFEVDHTPPNLEMIQPLDAQEVLQGGMVSGYVDPTSELIINGEKISVDESGYFRADGFGTQVELVATDDLGNEMKYSWSATKTNKNLTWIWYTAANLLLVGITVLIVMILRRKRKQ